MDLIDDYNGHYYWQLFDDGSQRTSQEFDSPEEAWQARMENRLIWK